MWRRVAFAIGVVGLGSLFALAGAEPAGASLDGPCTASGTIVETGDVYDPKVIDEATIPRSGKVAWQGATGVAKERKTRGEVRVAFPPPIGEIAVGEWGKDGKKSSRPGNSGTYTYDLPALVAGIEIPVSGFHQEPGIRCSGAVVVKVDGTSPLAWASLAVTVVAIAGLSLAMQARPKAGV